MYDFAYPSKISRASYKSIGIKRNLAITLDYQSATAFNILLLNNVINILVLKQH